jgi:PBSX family phage terminase large subunit
MLPKIPLSPKQLDFLQNSDSRVSFLDGSVRSGKTYIVMLRWLIFVAMAPMDGALVMSGRTRDSVWRNNISLLQDPTLFGSLSKLVVGNYGAPTVKILGRVVHVLGGSDTASEMVLRGLTVRGVCIDEATTLHQNFFKQMLLRMSKTGAQMFATTNPDNPMHWLKKEYLDRIGAKKNPLRTWKRWKFMMDDNPSLTAATKRMLIEGAPGLWYRRYIEGEWVVAEGAVFDFWEPSDFVVPHDSLPAMVRIYGLGIDYGTTHATSAICLGLGTDGILYLLNEWRYEAEEKDLRLNDEKIVNRIKEFVDEPLLPKAVERGLKPEWTIVDPAAASLKVMLGDHGFRNLLNADNEVLYGIRLMSSLFTSGKLKVSDACEGLLAEMPGYSWDPKATLKGEDAPMKVNDDSIDPARYVLVTTESLWRSDLGLAA